MCARTRRASFIPADGRMAAISTKADWGSLVRNLAIWIKLIQGSLIQDPEKVVQE